MIAQSSLASAETRLAAIARLNDRCRQGIDRTARIMVTRTCLGTFATGDRAMEIVVQARLFAAVRRHVFTEADAAERDRGNFEFDLARCEAMLVDARSGWLYGLDRAFSRAERGTLLVEVRNRRHLLAIGRTDAKPKGPRFDLKLLPDAALLRLIQTHGDAGLVERMRQERSRREMRGT